MHFVNFQSDGKRETEYLTHIWRGVIHEIPVFFFFIYQNFVFYLVRKVTRKIANKPVQDRIGPSLTEKSKFRSFKKKNFVNFFINFFLHFFIFIFVHD